MSSAPSVLRNAASVQDMLEKLGETWEPIARQTRKSSTRPMRFQVGLGAKRLVERLDGLPGLYWTTGQGGHPSILDEHLEQNPLRASFLLRLAGCPAASISDIISPLIAE